MKKIKFLLVISAMVFLLSSCSVWNKLFAPKYGCPTDGKNVGAEKILSGNHAAMKSAAKAKKIKL